MAGGAKFHDSCHSGSGSGYGTMVSPSQYISQCANFKIEPNRNGNVSVGFKKAECENFLKYERTNKQCLGESAILPPTVHVHVCD